MARRSLLSLPVPRLPRVVPAAAGLALLAAVVPAGPASAAAAGCTTSGSQVTCIFTETGGAQTWTVPAGISQATFILYGAEGGNDGGLDAAGGLGAKVTATLPVTAGTVLQVNAGQTGPNGGLGGAHAFGGGGIGGNDGGGGGGASDVRSPASDGSYPLAQRLLVAAGGGGGGLTDLSPAGPGGNSGTAGNPGTGSTDCGATLGGGGGGGAGTSAAGGTGGSGGAVSGTSSCTAFAGGGGGTGSAGDGGDGGTGFGGGGGGGGYYGGGGGGGGALDLDGAGGGGAGGGGGSSYTGGVSGATITDGVAAPDDAPNGEVIITYTLPGAAAHLADLRQDIRGVGLGHGQVLTATVVLAQRELAAGQRRAVCVTMTTFILEVKVQTPWAIHASKAKWLTEDARQIQAALAC